MCDKTVKIIMSDIRNKEQLPEFLKKREAGLSADSQDEFENIARAIEDMIDQRSDKRPAPSFASEEENREENESLTDSSHLTEDLLQNRPIKNGDNGTNNGAHGTAWAVNQILTGRDESVAITTSAHLPAKQQDDTPVSAMQSHAPAGAHTVLDALVLEALQPLLRQWLQDNMPEMIAPMVRDELKNRVIKSVTSTTEMRAEPEQVQNIPPQNPPDDRF